MWKVEVGLDTAPGCQPRSYEYNNKGMLLEGWKQLGNPLFGASVFMKEVPTEKEARDLKAKIFVQVKKLHENGDIRGGYATVKEIT